MTADDKTRYLKKKKDYSKTVGWGEVAEATDVSSKLVRTCLVLLRGGEEDSSGNV